MSNSEYNPFREEYIDPSAPDPNVDFAGFDVPFSDNGQTLSDNAGAGFAPPGGGRGSGVALPAACAAPGAGDFLRPAAGADEFSIPSAADDAFEDFVSGGGFEVTSESGFDASELEFIPSEATVEQQRLDVDGRPEFTDPLPLGGGYVARPAGRTVRGGGRAPRP